MSNTHHNRPSELELLLNRLCDQSLTKEDFSRLNAILATEAGAQEAFCRLIRLHADLSWQNAPVRPFSTEELIAIASVENTTREQDDGRRRHSVCAEPRLESPNSRERFVRQIGKTSPWFVAAALLLVALVSTWQMWPSGRLSGDSGASERPLAAVPQDDAPAAAMLVRSVGSEFADAIRSPEIGELRPGQFVEFGQGVAEIRFHIGATVVLTGPARFRIDSNDRATLFLGELAAHVDEGGEGFTVVTPDAEITDLGTEFTVVVPSAGPSKIQVLSGLVDVISLAASQTPTRLSAGEGAHVTKEEPVTVLRSQDSQVDGVVRSLAKPDFTFQAVKDAYVVGGMWRDTNFRNSADLLVKLDVKEQEFNRRAWIEFDLSEIDHQNIVAARLILTVAPNKIAEEEEPRFHITADKTWQFEVAGLWDELFADWHEASITWANAPGNDPEETTGRMSGFRAPLRVGTFSIYKHGTRGETVVIDGPDLVEFLRADQDGRLTFIVSRLTGYLWKGDQDLVVHGFASRENADLAPPTLEIWGNVDRGEKNRGSDTQLE